MDILYMYIHTANALSYHVFNWENDNMHINTLILNKCKCIQGFGKDATLIK